MFLLQGQISPANPIMFLFMQVRLSRIVKTIIIKTLGFYSWLKDYIHDFKKDYLHDQKVAYKKKDIHTTRPSTKRMSAIVWWRIYIFAPDAGPRPDPRTRRHPGPLKIPNACRIAPKSKNLHWFCRPPWIERTNLSTNNWIWNYSTSRTEMQKIV